MCQKNIKKYSYILIAIALNILFFYPVIFSDKTFFFRDIHRWFYPMKYFLATSFKAYALLWIKGRFKPSSYR